MKRSRIIITVTALTLVVALGVVSVLAVTGGWFTDRWSNTAAPQAGVVKYEKPDIGEIAQNGAYPEEKDSSDSAEASPKQWYEYINYSTTPIYEYEENGVKYAFYDPFDYSYGLTMELTNTNLTTDKANGVTVEFDEYTTANDVQISYTKEKSYSWTEEDNVALGFEEKVTIDTLIADTEVTFKQDLGWADIETDANSESTNVSLTYSAVYFNENGTPYPWRVVHYKVVLPLYCEKMTMVNEKWVVTEYNYLMVTTIEGSCREWLENGQAYLEDWRTGDKVLRDDFINEFKDEDALKEALKNPEKEWIPTG